MVALGTRTIARAHAEKLIIASSPPRRSPLMRADENNDMVKVVVFLADRRRRAFLFGSSPTTAGTTPAAFNAGVRRPRAAARAARRGRLMAGRVQEDLIPTPGCFPLRLRRVARRPRPRASARSARARSSEFLARRGPTRPARNYGACAAGRRPHGPRAQPDRRRRARARAGGAKAVFRARVAARPRARRAGALVIPANSGVGG